MLEWLQELELWPRRAHLRLHGSWLRGAITRGPAVDQVALTFDDGPDERWTPEILVRLERQRARATFFMIGAHVAAAPELAREVVDRGHEAAVHLYSHDRAVVRDPARFRDEVRRTRDLIQSATGTAPRLLRFPFAALGRQRPRQIQREHGLTTVHWSFSSLDSRADAVRIRRRFRRVVFPGAIVLFHDGVGSGSQYATDRQATVEALPYVLADCRARQLAPVTLSTLLAGGGRRW